jgi:maltose alpha-D-glucosyltransferase/alpha-amylase
VPSVLAHRCDFDGSTVVAVHELAGREAEVTLPVDDGDRLVDLLDEAEHPLGERLALEPYAARWFRVRRAGVRLPP